MELRVQFQGGNYNGMPLWIGMNIIVMVDGRSMIDPNPQRHAIGVAALELYSQFQVAELLRHASGYSNYR